MWICIIKKVKNIKKVKSIKFSTIYLLLVFLLPSCGEEENTLELNLDSFKEISTPCKSGGEPNLFVDENGEVYLLWVDIMGRIFK